MMLFLRSNADPRRREETTKEIYKQTGDEFRNMNLKKMEDSSFIIFLSAH